MDRENEKAPVKKDRGEEDTMCHYSVDEDGSYLEK